MTFNCMKCLLFVTANCTPPCKNGGMCLRPHICVCTPGSKGKSCEQTTLPPSSHPTGPLNGHTNGGLPNGGHTNGYPNGHNVIPQRPIPQQIFPQGQGQVPLPLPGTNMRHLTLSMKPSPKGPIPYQPQWVWHLDSVIYSIIILRHGSRFEWIFSHNGCLALYFLVFGLLGQQIHFKQAKTFLIDYTY